jgi:hypothetical protein
MDARLWHQQATAPSIALPPPVPVEVFDEMPDAAQDAYWEVLSSGLATVVLPSVLAQDVPPRELTRLVERNTAPPARREGHRLGQRTVRGRQVHVRQGLGPGGIPRPARPGLRVTRGPRGTRNQASPPTGSRTSTSPCAPPPGSATCSPRCC